MDQVPHWNTLDSVVVVVAAAAAAAVIRTKHFEVAKLELVAVATVIAVGRVGAHAVDSVADQHHYYYCIEVDSDSDSKRQSKNIDLSYRRRYLWWREIRRSLRLGEMKHCVDCLLRGIVSC